MRSLRLTIAAALTLLAVGFATAADVRVIVSPGFVPMLPELGPAFERASGHKLVAAGDALALIIKRVRGGEAVDLVLAPRNALDAFVEEGLANAANATPVATAGMGVAVRAGAARPDVSSSDAFKRALLAARAITYPDPHTPTGNPLLGAHLERVFARLGIVGEMKAKTVFDNTVDLGDLVARGTVDLGIAQIQNLNRAAGIDIAGPLPAELQDAVIFTAVVLNASREPAAAKAFIDFMRSPAALPALRAQRMDPAP